MRFTLNPAYFFGQTGATYSYLRYWLHTGMLIIIKYQYIFAHTKHFICNPGQRTMFLLHSQKYIGFIKDILLHGYYCPEFDTNGVKPKNNASSDISICNPPYNASVGYKSRKCFETLVQMKEKHVPYLQKMYQC